MMLQKESLLIRLIEEKDVQILSRWLSDPEVLFFYEGRDRPQTVDQVRKHYISSTNEARKNCMVEYEEQLIGYIQIYPLDEEWKQLYGYSLQINVWGMDQFIGETRYWNSGVGTKLVSVMVRYLMEEQGVDVIAMNPQTRNTRSIRCYEKCGFRKVKVLPEFEMHEGVFEDCWLMEYRK